MAGCWLLDLKDGSDYSDSGGSDSGIFSVANRYNVIFISVLVRYVADGDRCTKSKRSLTYVLEYNWVIGNGDGDDDSDDRDDCGDIF